MPNSCASNKKKYLCTMHTHGAIGMFQNEIRTFPDNIIEEYNLCNKVDSNGNVHCEVR
jgi:hypothetical protein